MSCSRGKAASQAGKSDSCVIRKDRWSLLVAVSPALAWLLEGANTCLLNEWFFPSMSFKNQGKGWYSVIEAIWSDFMEEVSCLFYISLSVLNSGGRKKLCLDAHASIHSEFPSQGRES